MKHCLPVPPNGDLSMHHISDRTGDPLLEGDQAVIDLLVQVAYNAWRQTGSTHNAAPCARALSRRILNPRPGDPVYVPDSTRRGATEDTRRKGVGYLVVRRTEWSHTDTAWLAVIEGENPESKWASPFGQWTDGEPLVWNPLIHPNRPKVDVFYVQYGPKPIDICRWENATCNALPLGDDLLRQVDEDSSLIVQRERTAW